MSIQSFKASYIPRAPLVDAHGIPTTSYGNFFLLGLWNRTGAGTGIIPKVSPGLTATGGSQLTAYAVTFDWNWFTTVGSGTGAIILPLLPGQTIKFQNSGLNALSIYPSVGAQIDQLGLNAAYSLGVNDLIEFECWSQTQLFSA